LHRQEIVEALLFFVGLYLLSRTSQNWTSIRRKLRYRNSHDWPIAQAVIQTQRIERSDSSTRNNHRVILEYSYSVAGQAYSGSHVTNVMYFEADAIRFCDRFPVGTLVMARLNPAWPEDSVLDLPAKTVPF